MIKAAFFTINELKEKIKTNFIFLPLLLCFASIVLVNGLSFLSKYGMLLWLDKKIFLTSSETSLTILQIIASSTITIISVSFSITILTLSLASNQMGPRLIPQFLKQYKTQFILGFLIASFVYCLLAIKAIDNHPEDILLAQAYLFFGFILGISCTLLFLLFIEHVANTIKIDGIIRFSYQSLVELINQHHNYNEYLNQKMHGRYKGDSATKSDFSAKGYIRSQKAGYIQRVNYKKLYDFAIKHDLTIMVEKKVGQFVYPKELVFLCSKALDEKQQNFCLNQILISHNREALSDIELAFEQFSEIALKSMSNSNSNPYTAISATRFMVASIIELNNICSLADSYYYKDTVKLIIDSPSDTSIINTCFDLLRQHAFEQNELSVLIAQLDAIYVLLKQPLKMEIKDGLLLQIEAIKDIVFTQPLAEKDKNEISERFTAIDDLLKV